MGGCYNKINGDYAGGNKVLLEDVLKGARGLRDVRLGRDPEMGVRALKLLQRSGYRRIHRRHVQLGNLRSGAFPGIGDSKTYSYEAVIITLVLLPISFC